MWVARDNDGELDLYIDKPHRSKVPGWDQESWDSGNDYWIVLDPKLFPDLTWDDEAIEVELVKKN